MITKKQLLNEIKENGQKIAELSATFNKLIRLCLENGAKKDETVNIDKIKTSTSGVKKHIGRENKFCRFANGTPYRVTLHLKPEYAQVQNVSDGRLKTITMNVIASLIKEYPIGVENGDLVGFIATQVGVLEETITKYIGAMINAGHLFNVGKRKQRLIIINYNHFDTVQGGNKK